MAKLWSESSFWGHDGRAVRIAVWEVVFALAGALWCGLLPGTAIDSSQYGRYADRRLGICNGQFCYSWRTVAGQTPPLVEQVVGVFMPVWVRHAMAPNLAGYEIVAVPLWPLLAVTGWPVVSWLVVEWVARYRGRRNRRLVGFDVVMPAAESAAVPSRRDLTPPVPPSRAQG